ncbi:mitochondrial small ribosomal subunit Rsm22-domain-containing protein [Jimgerdemannia flammicorona]|uniref:Mitochondrial small ribosomal subunit Rsm22-domain-containing protein n=1 Tax=Jimgerdemannia flammicorona TaxID=994334 RepID=A0A433DC65_9FUNG|nr:mitochondrial small ribosomal subunit Rsm22-domain-containing protein [Jimgerdemannia flammicorona]
MHAFRTLPPNLRSPPRPLLRCLRHTLASTNSSAAPQATLILAQVSPQSETSTEEAEESIPYHRGSPEAAFGCKRIGCVVLPPDLDLGIKAILEDESKGLLRTDALRIYESFRSTSRLQEDPDDPPPQSKRSGKDKRPSHKSKDATPLSSPTLNPHVIDYGHRESVAYLAGAMSSTYAAVYNVLREIRGRMPTFVPASVFDFGSGPGTALWASREVFPESLASYRGVDISEAMIGVAEKLLTREWLYDQGIGI